MLPDSGPCGPTAGTTTADAWSTGEVLAVAYLLDSRDVLAEMGEDENTVLGRWAYDLWGISGGEADETAGLRRTRKWFMETRSLAAADAQ